jgi:hypothetical protein
LAIRVVEAGRRGYFTTAEDMCTNLVAVRVDGTWSTELRTYTAPTTPRAAPGDDPFVRCAGLAVSLPAQGRLEGRIGGDRR